MLGEYTKDWTIYHFVGLVFAIVFIPTVYGVILSAAIKNDKKGQEYYKKEGWSGKRIFRLLTDILSSFPVAFPVMMIVLVMLIPMAIDYINQHWGMEVVDRHRQCWLNTDPNQTLASDEECSLKIWRFDKKRRK